MSAPPTFTAILQPKGLLHRFIRSKDISTIVERPERLRAVAVGIAAAAARLETLERPPISSSSSHNELGNPGVPPAAPVKTEALDDADDLAQALDRLALASNVGSTSAFNIFSASPVTLQLLNSEVVRFIHGEAHEYLAKIVSWAAESETKIRAGGSEIPTGFSQGDLYLCPQSIEAIAGSISAVCEAVDVSLQDLIPSSPSKIAVPPASALPSDSSLEALMAATQLSDMPSLPDPLVPEEATTIPLPPSPLPTPRQLDKATPRVFAAIRPPGHHCSDEMPSGFCFVNNVMIGVAHAHLNYGMKRFIVLDFDLHHGNGTQAIVWSINAETARQEEEAEAKAAAGLPRGTVGPKIFYGSLHDILSFPCEDGDAALVQAASTTLSGAHGQYIQNVHLDTYESDEDFFTRLYPTYRERLLGNAARFLAECGYTPNGTMVFVSAGFDASPHEHSYMSRHSRNVPTAFYTKFAQDVIAFADQHAGGRVVSVLEGGYSDWALMSASAAYVSGLARPEDAEELIRQKWWEADSLEQLQKLCKPQARSGNKPRLSKTSQAAAASEPAWLKRTREILEVSMDRELFLALPPLPNLRAPPPPAAPTVRRTLRERVPKKEPDSAPSSQPASPARKPAATRQPKPATTRTPASSPPKAKPKPVSVAVKPVPVLPLRSDSASGTSPLPVSNGTERSRPPASAPAPRQQSSSSSITSPTLLSSTTGRAPPSKATSPPASSTAQRFAFAVPGPQRSNSNSASASSAPRSVAPGTNLAAQSDPLKIRIKLPARVKSATEVPKSSSAPVQDAAPASSGAADVLPPTTTASLPAPDIVLPTVPLLPVEPSPKPENL